MRAYDSQFNKSNKNRKAAKQASVFPSVKRPSEYQGYRTTDRTGSISSMPILIGAAMIAAAILLSGLVSAVATRYVGLEGSTDDTAWLVDRLTGSVYRCDAPVRGEANCQPEISTGSIPTRPKP